MDRFQARRAFVADARRGELAGSPGRDNQRAGSVDYRGRVQSRPILAITVLALVMLGCGLYAGSWTGLARANPRRLAHGPMTGTELGCLVEPATSNSKARSHRCRTRASLTGTGEDPVDRRPRPRP